MQIMGKIFQPIQQEGEQAVSVLRWNLMPLFEGGDVPGSIWRKLGVGGSVLSGKKSKTVT